MKGAVVAAVLAAVLLLPLAAMPAAAERGLPPRDVPMVEHGRTERFEGGEWVRVRIGDVSLGVIWSTRNDTRQTGVRFFLDYGYFTYLPIYLAIARGTSPAVVGLLFGAFALGAMVTASQAGRLARGRDPAALVFLGFALAGGSLLAIPLLPHAALVGVSLAVYGLGNGLISPLQKSLLTQNAPPAARASVVSLDRVFQQVAKALAPALMGALLLVADVTAVFWALGALSLASVALAALLLTAARQSRAPVPAG